LPGAESDFDPENLIERPESGLYNYAEIIYRTKGRIPPLCDLQYALASLPPLLPARIGKPYLLCREKKEMRDGRESWPRCQMFRGWKGGGWSQMQRQQEIMALFTGTEAEILDKIQTKVLRVFLLFIHSHL
jgi:hypothetical protein